VNFGVKNVEVLNAVTCIFMYLLIYLRFRFILLLASTSLYGQGFILYLPVYFVTVTFTSHSETRLK
jgi:hypothetical protein